MTLFNGLKCTSLKKIAIKNQADACVPKLMVGFTVIIKRLREYEF